MADLDPWDEIEQRSAEIVALKPPLDPVETFPLADLALWDRTPATPKAFVMAGFVPANELTLATGAGGANKSTFGQQLATCCAAGLPMLGVEVQQGSALYITAEDDDDRLHWMQEHICRALGVRMTELAGKLHLASLRGRLGNELATFDAEGKLRPSSTFAILKATIEQSQARLVVLDNAAHLFAGNENDRRQVTAFVNLLYSLCRDLGTTIMLVAHSNKAGDSYSGSTAWPNSVRSQIVLQHPEESLDPDERVLTLGKANYARQGAELRFRWHDFALVRDEDLPPSVAAQIRDIARANGDNDLFLRCLAKATDDKRAVSHNQGTNYAPKIFAAMPMAKGTDQRALAQAMERLLNIGAIALDQPLWRGPNRVMKQGIKAVEKCTDPPARTPCTDPHAPHTQVIENTAPTQCAPTPLYTTYITGAAHGSAAPSPSYDDDDGLDETSDDWWLRNGGGA